MSVQLTIIQSVYLHIGHPIEATKAATRKNG